MSPGIYANTFFSQQGTSALRLASVGSEQILVDLVSNLDREILGRELIEKPKGHKKILV